MADSVLTRVRHPLRYRRVFVERVSPLTPRMRRIVVAGAELDGFTSPGFDDHVKLFFPDAAGRLPAPVVGADRLEFPEGPPPPGRDFTPRHFDAARRELTLDMGVHGDGPAARWAATAAPGTPLGIAGPRGSTIVRDGLAWNLLVGDETAVPAIARRFEEAPPGLSIVALIEVEDAAEELPLPSSARVDVRWIHRGGATSIDEVLAAVQLPAGEGFAWVAGERDLARRIRRHFIEVMGLPPGHVKASAYWRRGETGRHEVLGDE